MKSKQAVLPNPCLEEEEDSLLRFDDHVKPLPVVPFKIRRRVAIGCQIPCLKWKTSGEGMKIFLFRISFSFRKILEMGISALKLV
jgi:hypothetical protein